MDEGISKENKVTENGTGRERRLVENVDYYFERGLMVLTEKFLLERGYCCGNSCRHCPYPEDGSAEG